MLMDRSLIKAVYPVINRPRLTYSKDEPNVFYNYKQNDKVAFECVGDYLTHHTLSLTDIFVSMWFATAQSKWQQDFNEPYPSTIPVTTYNNPNAGRIFNKFRIASPFLNGKWEDADYKDYLTLSISSREFRQHPGLRELRLGDLDSIIEKTAGSKLKLDYIARILKKTGKTEKRELQKVTFDKCEPLFEYRVGREVKSRKGDRVLIREYQFSFENCLVAKFMIHNTIFGGFVDIPNTLFECSMYAQLLYRFVRASQATSKLEYEWSIDALYHYLDLRWDKNSPRRMVERIESLLLELNHQNLIENVQVFNQSGSGYKCKFNRIQETPDINRKTSRNKT